MGVYALSEAYQIGGKSSVSKSHVEKSAESSAACSPLSAPAKDMVESAVTWEVFVRRAKKVSQQLVNIFE